MKSKIEYLNSIPNLKWWREEWKYPPMIAYLGILSFHDGVKSYQSANTDEEAALDRLVAWVEKNYGADSTKTND